MSRGALSWSRLRSLDGIAEAYREAFLPTIGRSRKPEGHTMDGCRNPTPECVRLGYCHKVAEGRWQCTMPRTSCPTGLARVEKAVHGGRMPLCPRRMPDWRPALTPQVSRDSHTPPPIGIPTTDGLTVRAFLRAVAVEATQIPEMSVAAWDVIRDEDNATHVEWTALLEYTDARRLELKPWRKPGSEPAVERESVGNGSR